MVQIGGKYQLVKNENFLEHLVALGVPEDKATESSLEKPIINITVNGKNITICVENIKNPHCSNLILDQEVDEVFGGTNFKSFAKLDGDILTVNAKFPDGKTGKRVYSFSDSDLVLSYSNSKSEVPEAKRYYKRL